MSIKPWIFRVKEVHGNAGWFKFGLMNDKKGYHPLINYKELMEDSDSGWGSLSFAIEWCNTHDNLIIDIKLSNLWK